MSSRQANGTAERRSALPDADVIDTRVVKALAHPTRVRILGVLRERELISPVELSHELGVPLGTVGYHVRRLEQLGFLELATRTQRRGAVEHHYRARAALDLPAAGRCGRAGGPRPEPRLRQMDSWRRRATRSRAAASTPSRRLPSGVR